MAHAMTDPRVGLTKLPISFRAYDGVLRRCSPTRGRLRTSRGWDFLSLVAHWRRWPNTAPLRAKTEEREGLAPTRNGRVLSSRVCHPGLNWPFLLFGA